MKRMSKHRMWAVLAVLTSTACGESGMGLPDDASLTAEEAAELALLEDAGSLEVAFALNEEFGAVAARFGTGNPDQGHALNAQSRAQFLAARAALHEGDGRRALEVARNARVLAARALVAAGGAEAVEALIEQLEELVLTLEAGDDDLFHDPDGLLQRLEALVAEARAHLEADELVAAAERALLGEQIVRYHRGRPDRRGDVTEERATLAVDLARTAVELAEQLVDAPDTPVPAADPSVRDRMNRWLVHAHRFLSLAELALENGRYAAAAHLAHHAGFSALKAVVLPGGVTHEEAQAMADLANELYAEAQEAVGDTPTELEAHLLELAGRLIERGEEALENGHVRGVAALWKAAVISSWLIG